MGMQSACIRMPAIGSSRQADSKYFKPSLREEKGSASFSIRKIQCGVDNDQVSISSEETSVFWSIPCGCGFHDISTPNPSDRDGGFVRIPQETEFWVMAHAFENWTIVRFVSNFKLCLNRIIVLTRRQTLESVQVIHCVITVLDSSLELITRMPRMICGSLGSTR